MQKSEILEDYKLIKKVGKGASGVVILSQNPSGNMQAIKVIVKQKVDQHSHENLKSQVQLMQQCNSDHIMKLLRFEEDDEYYYLFCEYCNQGDLKQYQSRKKNRVFELQQAVQAMSCVIKGLWHMHRRNILHRDIKLQNILVNRNEYGIINFKLADLGFSKHYNQIHGTVLGTQSYMSPQIFSHQDYGFQVDMWAFGVTLFFMLNQEYPFYVNPHVIFEERAKILKKLSQNFSYKKAVQKTKKKMIHNCSEDMQDLFKRIFEPCKQKRIKFSEIIEHPIFYRHFPDGATKSSIVYKKNFKYSPKFSKKQQIIPFSPLKKRDITKNSKKQRQYIEAQHTKLNFLKDTNTEIQTYTSILSHSQMISFRYLLNKMTLKYLKQYMKLLNLGQLYKKFPNCQWDKFCSHKSLNLLIAKYQNQFSQEQMHLNDLYEQCLQQLDQIQKIQNHHYFRKVLESDYTEQKSGEQMLKAFNYSSRHCYKKFSDKQSQDPKYAYMAVVLLICNLFRKIFPTSQSQLIIILENYSKSRKNKDAPINFDDLRWWLFGASIRNLKQIQQSMIKKYLKTC